MGPTAISLLTLYTGSSTMFKSPTRLWLSYQNWKSGMDAWMLQVPSNDGALSSTFLFHTIVMRNSNPSMSPPMDLIEITTSVIQWIIFIQLLSSLMTETSILYLTTKLSRLTLDTLSCREDKEGRKEVGENKCKTFASIYGNIISH